MKKNVNKKSNNRSKVASAFAMLLVSAVALSSASYAWFTMSKQVEVTGLELSATAPDNVLICKNYKNDEAEPYKNIGNYASSVALTVDGTSTDVLRGGAATAVQTADKLYPASSADGVNIFQTSDIEDKGGAKTGAVFTVASNETNLYYVDVPLYILTTGSSDVNVQLDETQSEINPKDNTEIYKAVRFAILDKDGANLDGDTPEVYGATNTYFNNGAVKSIEQTPTFETTGENGPAHLVKAGTVDGTAYDGKNIALAGTTNATQKNVSEKYQYTKITVRVWIEGQNSNCITANADQSFNIKLVFKNPAAN